MSSQQHTSFEIWQGDVMRTLVDAGPLATSYFAATERHQESLRMASCARTGAASPRLGLGAHLASFRQHGMRAFAAARFALQAFRPKAAMRRSVSRSASVQ